MREVNFSIPNVNKASVGITTALYDRRALDCTSTLPLINSLNHLAYLTTSSGRIRDILTVDGGVERLVCILKQGRSQEQMEKWKWNLAFQCVVNIGVRGSEAVRTRVVEADMVPVIASVLDNYVKVIDRLKEKADAENDRLYPGRRSGHRSGSRSSRRHESNDEVTDATLTRRQPPPPAITIPPSVPLRLRSRTYDSPTPMEISPTRQSTPASPPGSSHSTATRQERTNMGNISLTPRHHHHRSDGLRSPSVRAAQPPPIDADHLHEAARELGLRPVRDADRLPSMLPSVSQGVTSQPESPTTPMAPILAPAQTGNRERRRAALRQEASVVDFDDAEADQSPAEMDQEGAAQEGEPMVDIQTEDLTNQDTMLNLVAQPPELRNDAGSEAPEVETFTLPHAPAQDGSIIQTNIRSPPATTQAGHSSAATIVSASPIRSATVSRFSLPQSAHAAVQAATPREDDVIMSLQLLAYVSKYCNLRTYFQNSHLVPALEIGANLRLLDQDAEAAQIEAEAAKHAATEEYLLPDDYNIFPLVEKFTVRHHSTDMQYWAGVVMRNLCRKDDSRGGIRQCAYYKCGKWEQFTRQFAKCRRCRRTKYCSKECQKQAWVYHRHWCQVAGT